MLEISIEFLFNYNIITHNTDCAKQNKYICIEINIGIFVKYTYMVSLSLYIKTVT